MPKKPTDYSKTIIYKIQNIDNPELLYVGSTTDFTKRKYQHKWCCNNPNDKCYNYKLYSMIRDNGGWDMFNMVIVKEYPCENKRQAEAEEDRCIREMKATLNSIRAFITPEERIEHNKQYRLEHKDKIAERDKQYRLEHKDKIAEQTKQYYTENKDKYKQWRLENKEQNAEKQQQYRLENKEQIAERTKQYRLENKDKILEYKKQYYLENKEQIAERTKQYILENKEQIAERRKQYYIENKDEIAEQRKQKITCECGCVLNKVHLPRHKRSFKHQDLLNKHLV